MIFDQFDSRFVEAAGLRTHYVEVGEGDPVVLVHGGGAGADGRSNFADNLPEIGKRYRAIAYDMPGFGLTDRPDPADYEYTQETRTRHLIAFLEAVDCGPVHLVGNSLGGTTACDTALRRPDLVRTLVLMGAAVNMSAQDMAANRDNLAPVLAYDDTPAGMRRIVDSLTHDYVASDELLDYRYEMSVRPDAKVAFKTLMGWVGKNGLDFGDRLATLEMPVQVLAGKQDIMIPISKQYELLRAIPQAEGTILADCGHWVMVEFPSLFNQLTMSFFDRRG